MTLYNLGMSTDISVITVSYNSGEFIADAIESVNRQEVSPLEHIIIDGASSDQTLGIIQQLRRPFTQIVSEADEGIYDAMNKGISMAKGDIIGFLNSDDFYPSCDVLQQVQKVFSKKNADIVYGDLSYVSRMNIKQIRRLWNSGPFLLEKLGRGWHPPHPCFFAKRTLYQELGGFDLNYKMATDTELMIRFLSHQCVKVEYLPYTLVHMRLGGESNKSMRNIIAQNLWLNKAMQANLKSRSPLWFPLKVLNRLQQRFNAFRYMLQRDSETDSKVNLF